MTSLEVWRARSTRQRLSCKDAPDFNLVKVIKKKRWEIKMWKNKGEWLREGLEPANWQMACHALANWATESFGNSVAWCWRCLTCQKKHFTLLWSSLCVDGKLDKNNSDWSQPTRQVQSNQKYSQVQVNLAASDAQKLQLKHWNATSKQLTLQSGSHVNVTSLMLEFNSSA